MKTCDQLVSIIMPAFNAEKTISDSIQSVMEQSFKNWELVIIDDGSQDGTLRVVNDFNCDKIKIVNNSYDKGAAGARKTGIENSQGRFIAFLDSDDIWEPKKLQIQLEYMIEKNVYFTYSDYYTFNTDIFNPRSAIIAPNKLTYSDLIKNCMIGCLTVVLDREAFFDFDFPICPKEEYAFWLKLLKQNDCAYKVPGTMSFYRLSSISLSGNKFKEIKKQWHVVRIVEKTSFIRSIYYLTHYVTSGVIKHYIVPLFYTNRSWKAKKSDLQKDDL